MRMRSIWNVTERKKAESNVTLTPQSTFSLISHRS